MSTRLKSPASRLFTQTFIQGADQRKHQSSASLVFVMEIHRWPVNSPHKGPVTRKMFPLDDVIMNMTSLFNFWGATYSCSDQRKHQSSASLVFVMEIHRWPVNSPHKGPVTRKMFPLDDVIMNMTSLFNFWGATYSCSEWVFVIST